MDRLNAISIPQDMENQWFYDNERILYFKDGFIHPDAVHLVYKLGALTEAFSLDDSGYTAATSPWEYGTCR